MEQMELLPRNTVFRDRRRTLDALLAIVTVCAALPLALYVVDFPSVDSHAAPHVKKIRYGSKENVFRSEGYSRFQVNSFGLIGREPASIARQDTFRIAMFGDSFVEALQVPPTDRMDELVQHALRPPIGFRKIEVWNFGFSGDNTGNAFARWVHRPQAVRFHAAIFAFNAGDVFENRLENAKPPIGALLVDDGAGGFALDESHIVATPSSALVSRLNTTFGEVSAALYVVKRRIADAYQSKLTKFESKFEGAHSIGRDRKGVGGDGVDISVAVRDSCRQLLFVRDSIRHDTGADVVLAALPSAEILEASNVEHDSQSAQAYKQLVRCLLDAGAHVADPRSALNETFSRGQDPFRDWNDLGGHYNSLGHRVVAREILNTFRAQMRSRQVAF